MRQVSPPFPGVFSFRVTAPSSSLQILPTLYHTGVLAEGFSSSPSAPSHPGLSSCQHQQIPLLPGLLTAHWIKGGTEVGLCVTIQGSQEVSGRAQTSSSEGKARRDHKTPDHTVLMELRFLCWDSQDHTPCDFHVPFPVSFSMFKPAFCPWCQ